jgi:CTP synthase
VYERHRHRYEVNPRCVASLEEAGMRFSGQDDRATRMEIIELPRNRFHVGVQFHPEFK